MTGSIRRGLAALLAVAAMLGAVALPVSPVAAHSWSRHYCGVAHPPRGGVKVYAHRVRCHTARHVYNAYVHGGPPKHWNCASALRRCYHGGFQQQPLSKHFISWNRVSHHG